MKIEIDSSDYDSLKSQLRDYAVKCDTLENQLKSISEKEMKAKAVDLAKRLLAEYLHAIFNKLGFNGDMRESLIIEDNLEHWLGASWWNSDRIQMEIGANVTKQFKKAFLRIWIKTENIKTEAYKL